MGVVAQFWMGNVVPQAPRHLETLVRAVREAAVRPIRGILGPATQVATAMAVLEPAPETVKLDEEEGLYGLDLDRLIVPEALRTGELHGRRIEERDLEIVTAWRLAYSLEALGEADSPALRERCRQDMADSLERGDTWVVERDGTPVASSSFNAALAEVVQVGGVWTPPEHRGRGYGRAAVAASLLDVRAEGVGRSVLFTGDENLPARRAYAALGYERIGDFRIVLLRA